MNFYVGLFDLHHAWRFDRCFISINRLLRRKSDFTVNEWILDSGAFTTVTKYGGYPETPAFYATHIRRWSACGGLRAAVAQDYICDPYVLQATGLDVRTHQRLTLERYLDLLDCDVADTYIMPVVQGYEPVDFVRHLEMYGDVLAPGAWVGVGSICKRSTNPAQVVEILQGIRAARPDLQLHGFGIKTTSLKSSYIRDSLTSADSMAWSYAARREGKKTNDWRYAQEFASKINDLTSLPTQLSLSLA